MGNPRSNGIAGAVPSGQPMRCLRIRTPPLKDGFQTSSTQDTDLRESASVAHIYGQNLVAAESLTAYGNPYGFAPETLKPTADRMLAMGVNRFVIHTSVHQPLFGPGPGIGLGPFGQWFTRRETWAELWRADSGAIEPLSYRIEQDRTIVPLNLQPHDALFVLFRRLATVRARTLCNQACWGLPRL